MGAFSLFDGGLYPVGVPSVAPTVGYALLGLVGFSVGVPAPTAQADGGGGGFLPGRPKKKPKVSETSDEEFLLLLGGEPG